MEIPIKLQEIVDPNKECCCIYHFSNKCKEWAYTAIEPCGIIDSNFAVKGNAFLKTGGVHERYFYANTEPEAIFKATSYIMEQLKQKD